MNLNELVWNNEVSWLDKINMLSEIKNGLESKITNDIPIVFNTNYIFRYNWDNLSYNDQWKEVDLAIKILNETRNWNRKYNFNWNKKINTEYFITFFKEYINIPTYKLNAMGCCWYANNRVASIKTLLNWGNKLFNNKLINKEILNKYLEYLEEFNNEK